MAEEQIALGICMGFCCDCGSHILPTDAVVRDAAHDGWVHEECPCRH